MLTHSFSNLSLSYYNIFFSLVQESLLDETTILESCIKQHQILAILLL